MSRNPADVHTWLATHDPLRIIPLIDPVIETVGHQTRSTYAETYWLPVIGPSALWALRRLSAWAEADPHGVEVPLAELAQELGLGGGTGRNAPMVRTLARLIVFQMAQIDETNDALAVLRLVPPLAMRHLRRLPDHLVERHQAELEMVAAGR